MRKNLSTLTTAALLGALLCPAAAAAQEEAAPAEAAPPADVPEPAAEPPAAAEATPPAEATAAAEVAPPAAPATTATEALVVADEEKESAVPGWFRLDSDGYGLQLWVGATHSLGPVDIASDIYVNSATFAELDLGPSFTAEFGDGNSFIAIPMAGIGFDWAQKRGVSLIAPQLFLYLTAGPIYFESWTQAFINSIFDDTTTDSLYLRNFLLFKLSDHVSVGPHMEATLDLSGEGDTLQSLPLQGAVSLNYGENNTLLLALGYETQEAARQVQTGVDLTDPANPVDEYEDRGLAGRFTFVRLW
jgi:hypothetical protein